MIDGSLGASWCASSNAAIALSNCAELLVGEAEVRQQHAERRSRLIVPLPRKSATAGASASTTA